MSEMRCQACGGSRTLIDARGVQPCHACSPPYVSDLTGHLRALGYNLDDMTREEVNEAADALALRSGVVLPRKQP